MHGKIISQALEEQSQDSDLINYLHAPCFGYLSP